MGIGLFPIFGSYEYSCYKRLSSLGLSSPWGPTNWPWQLSPQRFCPVPLFQSQPNQTLDPLWMSDLFQGRIQDLVGVLPLPSSLRLLHERRIWGFKWDFVPLPKGSLLRTAHLCNLGCSLWSTSLAPNFLISTESTPMRKNLWVSTDSPVPALPVILNYRASHHLPFKNLLKILNAISFFTL